MIISHNLGVSRKVFAVAMAFFVAGAVLVSAPVSAQSIVTAGFAGKVVSVNSAANSFSATVRVLYSGASQSGVGTILPPGKVVTVNVPIGTTILDAQGRPISLFSVAPGMYFNARVNIDRATSAITATLIRFGTAQTPPLIPPQPTPPSTTVTAGFAGKISFIDFSNNFFNAEVRAVYAGGGYSGIGTILPPGKIVKVNVPSGVRLLDFYGNPMSLSQAQVGQYFNARVNVDRTTGAITAALIRFGTAVAPPELPPTIVVISPNGGEKWQIGTTQTIRWKSSPNIPTVDILLQSWSPVPPCIDPGPCPMPPISSYQLAKNIPNTGYYSWVVGSVPPNNVPAGQYTITVNQFNNFSVSDTSDAPFSIVTETPPPQPIVQVISPNGGETFYQGQTYNVSWLSPSGYFVGIFASPVAGGPDVLVTSTYAQINPPFSWAVPTTITPGKYWMKVQLAKQDANGKLQLVAEDLSDSPFAVSPPVSDKLKITVPNGGEVWQLNSLHTIQWTPYDPQNGVNVVPTVSAYLEKLVNGNFTTVGKIIESGKASIHWIGEIDNYGNYAQPGDYYVRVVNSQTNQWDRSDGSFKLVPQNTVTADLKINGSDGPIALPAGGGKVSFSWTSQNADSCTLYLNGLSDDLRNLPPSGQKDIFLKQNPYPAQLATALVCSSSIGDASDTVFISPYSGRGSYISITLPNGGEILPISSPYSINWVYSPDIVKVSIALYKNDAFFRWIAADLPWSGPGLLSWNPSSTVSASEIGGQVFKIYMIGYKSSGGTVEDKSDAPFSIIAGPTNPMFFISSVSGVKSVYAPSEKISLSIKAVEVVDGTAAEPGEGFNVQVYIFDSNRTKTYAGVNGTYNANTGLWDAFLTAPTDSSLKYDLQVFLYCSNSPSSCATKYGNGAQVEKTFTFSLSGAGNLPPVISGVSGPTTLNTGEAGTWKVTASDPENGSLSYGVVWGDEPLSVPPSCPPNVKCIKTATPVQQSATFTHSYANAGTYTPSFTVVDNAGLSAKTSISVNVKGTSSNNPPKITVFPPVSGQINVGQQVTFSWQATDPDNDNLYWSIDWGNGGVGSSCPSPLPAPSGQGWSFTASNTWNTAGIYTVKATVYDCKGGSYDSMFFVNVVPVPLPNVAPVITGWNYTPSQIRAGEPVQFTFNASDADNDNLSWSVDWGDGTGLKGGCPSSLLNNVYFAPHTWQNGGSYTIYLNVTDCKGGADNKSFAVSVLAGSPSITAIFPNGGESLAIGGTYNLQWRTQNLGTPKRNIMINLLNSQSVLVLPLFVGAYDDGVESWTVPTSLNPGTYKIKVSACVISGCYADESDGVFNFVFGVGAVPASTGMASVLESIQQQLNDIAKIVNSLGM